MYSQKIRLFSLNLVLVMLFTLIPVQAADVVIDDDGPLYTVVLNGNGGTYGDEKKETLSISYGNSPLYLEDYIFTKEGCTLLGWRESADENATTLDYTRFAPIYGGSTGEDTRTLYAVWGEGENCALYGRWYGRGVPDAAYARLGDYYVVNSESLPAARSDAANGYFNFIGWYDHINGVYYQGNSVRAGEVYMPIAVTNGNYPILLDGSGGESLFGSDLFYAGSTSTYFNDNFVVRGRSIHCFRKSDYIFDVWTDANGNAVANEHSGQTSLFIPEGDGIVRLYARWTPAYQLINGTRLVIDGDEMNRLLGNNSASTGNGWRFSDFGSPSNLSLYSPYGNTRPYEFSDFAYDGDFHLEVNGNVVTGQIEVNGRLGIHSDGSNASVISVETTDIPAIHAESVDLQNSDASYRISAGNAVGVDASYIYLGSPNITITGDPAVRADAKIVCHSSGIGYKISEDRTTLSTYVIDQSITLDGNNGTFDGKESVTVPYSVNAPLDLSQYAFTREGYELIGWAEDAEGTSYYRDRDSMLYAEDQKTLYAIWLKVPEDSAYAIFKASIPDAFSQYRPENGGAYSCVKIGTDFTMPKISDSAETAILWRNTDDHNLYFDGEAIIPSSGSWFNANYFGSSNECHTLVLDGNGGTYRYTLDSKTYNVNRQVVDSYVSNGQTINYAYNFTRPGYTLVSYNSKPDGSGTEYALNKCTVTADMEPIQILYAQWEKIPENKQYITIDGVRYNAAANFSGGDWDYYAYSDGSGELHLNGYRGGGIESNISLRISCWQETNTISGSISAPELMVGVYGDSSRLSVTATEGSALRSERRINLYCRENGSLSITGAENGSAVSAGDMLQIDCYDNGRIEALGGGVPALSAASIEKNDYQGLRILAGTSKTDAVEVEDYRDQQYVSYEVRTKTLTLHGNGGMTENSEDSISVDTKDTYVDLNQYRNSFANSGKALLGWSRTNDSSVIDYNNDSNTIFDFARGESAADLYAVWEDDNQKGITLNDYGSFVSSGMSSHDNYCYYQTYTEAAATNTKYTLLDSYKAGYQFLGWRSAQNGELYSAGTEVTVDQSKSYTAEYEVLTINIDGKSYGMDKPHGSQGIGWTYEPAASGNRYRSSEVTLYLYENYSGKPISILSDVRLRLGGNVTGESGQPAIYVDGDASVAIYNGGSGRISGGANAPALKVTGTLSVNNLIYGPCSDNNRTAVEFEGGNEQSAIDAERIWIPAAFYAGNDLSSAQLVGSYNSESYLRLEAPLTATVEPGETLPECPDTDDGRFVAWGKGDDYRWTEYALPGDVNDSISSKRYDAMFIRLWEGAVILNGNGGITNDEQKYYVVNSSGSDLELTVETATNAFHRDGYALEGYNTSANGTGTSYTAQELAAQVSGDGTVVGKVLTFFAQWTKSDEPVTPGKPATTPDGSTDYIVSGSTVTIENVDVDKLVTDTGEKKTAEIDLSDAKSGITDVTLPTDAVKKVAASDAENLTVKLPDVTVSFDDKALAAVADQSSGANLSLSVNVGGRDSLNSAQSNAVAEARELSVIEVSLSSNGEKISNFNGGSVTIDVPFQWSMRGLLRAYYIDENGNKSAIDVTYKNGVASLVLKHFSTYVVEAADLPEPFVSILPDSVTVDAVADVTNYVAAIYNADGKLLSVSTGKADTNSETVTIRCSTDPLTEQRTLKVFFLGEGDKPVRNAAVFNMAK